MPQLTLSAPCKLNLSLRVLHKREDGFHELETVMVPLAGLADTLTFTQADEFSFSCDKEGVPLDESNLVVQAVRGFEQATGRPVHYAVHLEKRVPHGAGLGGGSSDAAYTLLGLNTLHGEPLSFSELVEISTELGSDVPFFLYESPCLCKGRGEEVERLPAVESFPVILLKPAFGVSTPEAYKRWQDSVEISSFPYEAQRGPYGEMVNHLERPVFQKFLFLGELKKWLLDQPEVSVAQMSGSGSTMIILPHSLKDAASLVERARNTWDPNLFSWSGMS